jgi:hypothetical protein
MSGRVFVVQRPAYFDKGRQGWVNKYDLTPATEHGELVFLLRPGNIYKDKLRAAVELLKRELADYGPGDHILAVGDPVAIAATVMVAASVTGGRISLLKFDRQDGRYDAYEVDLAPNDG